MYFLGYHCWWWLWWYYYQHETHTKPLPTVSFYCSCHLALILFKHSVCQSLSLSAEGLHLTLNLWSGYYRVSTYEWALRHNVHVMSLSLQCIILDYHPLPVRGQGWVTDGAGLVSAAPHWQRAEHRAGPCPAVKTRPAAAWPEREQVPILHMLPPSLRLI